MAISVLCGRVAGLARRRIRVGLTAIAGAVGLLLAGAAPSAAALPPGCVQAGATVLCPFFSTGSEQRFVVPAGVFSLGVTAVGGKGGARATSLAGGSGGPGGFGAAQDYLVAFNGCLGPLAPGASCTVGVSFAPQAQGPSAASLQIASTDPGGPASVALSGTGGALPQGPTGQTGPRGPRGPAGQIELVVCHTVTKTVKTRGHKHKVTVQQCSARLVSGPVKFVTSGASSSASVTRGGVRYATGRAIRVGAGRWQLVLTRHMHRLAPGRCILTIATHQGQKRTVQRTTITIT